MIEVARAKNIRRTGVAASKGGIPNAEYGPTVQRLAIAQGNVSIGDDKQGGRTYTMRDSPLDRAHKKGMVSGAQHSALQKFRHHWYHGGSAPSVGSVDMDRIFSGDPGGMNGMPKSEKQAFHRSKYREAVEEIGLRSSFVVEGVVCYENSLDEVGMKLGWSSPYRAREGAKGLMVGAAVKLAKLWGIG